ncbi:uncharacterized protein LOC134842816 isoform X4 [Symsagittifera roscoffensis]|uniref:uncharacterized protein LOC134842816 isoform X4 n=1 Tax=Symsagittifera roscoffensis TaxID=84072 RepID=UPI00307B30B3
MVNQGFILTLKSFPLSGTTLFILSLLCVFLLTHGVHSNDEVLGDNVPLAHYSYASSRSQRLFHLDTADHYPSPSPSPTPSQSPSLSGTGGGANLDHVIFWGDFLFLAARDNIFKVSRDPSDPDGSSYHLRYAISLAMPERDKPCELMMSHPQICERRVKFLLPYSQKSLEPNSVVGCYSYNLQPHFFTLGLNPSSSSSSSLSSTQSPFALLNSSDPLVSALSMFCPVDPKVAGLTFAAPRGPKALNPNSYFFAQGTTRKGFELMRKDLLPPSELNVALTGPENAKADLTGSREPVVRHITTQNDADNSRGVGKAYPVSHFHWNGMTFVTFREPAVELSEIEEFKDTLFSRVAKVCDADKGRGVRYFSHRYWTSYAKARLICSSQPQGSGNSPGTAGTAPEFLFNEIQGTHVFQMSGNESSEDWRGEGLMVGIFDTPYTEMRTSAICIYDFGSIMSAFGGEQYGVQEPYSAPSQRNSDVIKDYSLDRCTNRSEDIDGGLVAFLQQHPLMQSPVRPLTPQPLFRTHPPHRLTSITGEQVQISSQTGPNQKSTGKEETNDKRRIRRESGTEGQKDSAKSKHFLIYAGTSDGRVIKLALNVTQSSEESQKRVERVWVGEWQVFAQSNPVSQVKLDPSSGQLLVTSSSQALLMPKSTCLTEQLPIGLPTCRACLMTRDPHCFWNVKSASCIYQPLPNRFSNDSNAINAYLFFPQVDRLCAVLDLKVTVDEPTAGEEQEKPEEVAVVPGIPSEGTGAESGKGQPANGESDLVNVDNGKERTDKDNNQKESLNTGPSGLVITPANKDGSSSEKVVAAAVEVLDGEASRGAKDKRLLTIAILTAIPCVVVGVMAGMGLLYCFAFYKANKHSRVAKSSPNELIYAPVPVTLQGRGVGKSPSGNSQDQCHKALENSYMYQQVYAQYLQIDPQAQQQSEEKHYSTISSTHPLSHPSISNEPHYTSNHNPYSVDPEGMQAHMIQTQVQNQGHSSSSPSAAAATTHSASFSNLLLPSQFGVHPNPLAPPLPPHHSLRKNPAGNSSAHGDSILSTSAMNGTPYRSISPRQDTNLARPHPPNRLDLHPAEQGLAGSMSRLQMNRGHSMSSHGHRQEDHTRFPQHHTVAPNGNHGSHGNQHNHHTPHSQSFNQMQNRALPRQPTQSSSSQLMGQRGDQRSPIGEGRLVGGLGGATGLPQSHSMLNYSHTQLYNPGHLLRDSSQLQLNSRTGDRNNGGANNPVQYRSDTRLFTPSQSNHPRHGQHPTAEGGDSGNNNTYGQDPLSSRVLLFATANQNHSGRGGAQVSNKVINNIPLIRKPTAVKYNHSNSDEAAGHYGSQGPYGSQSSAAPSPNPQPTRQNVGGKEQNSVYRSDYEPRELEGERLNGRVGGMRTSENPLYGTTNQIHQSQVAQRLARIANPPSPNLQNNHSNQRVDCNHRQRQRQMLPPMDAAETPKSSHRVRPKGGTFGVTSPGTATSLGGARGDRTCNGSSEWGREGRSPNLSNSPSPLDDTRSNGTPTPCMEKGDATDQLAINI